MFKRICAISASFWSDRSKINLSMNLCVAGLVLNVATFLLLAFIVPAPLTYAAAELPSTSIMPELLRSSYLLLILNLGISSLYLFVAKTRLSVLERRYFFYRLND
jgi:hypothetical protein